MDTMKDVPHRRRTHFLHSCVSQFGGLGFNVLGNTFGSFLLVLAGKYLFQTDTQIRVHFLSPTAFQASARYTLYRIFPESVLPLLATYNPENSCSCSGWEDGLIFIQNRGELSIFQLVWIWIWAIYWENFGGSIAQKLAASFMVLNDFWTQDLCLKRCCLMLFCLVYIGVSTKLATSFDLANSVQSAQKQFYSFTWCFD